MTFIISQESIERGYETEYYFKQWLDKHNIPYLYIQQDTKTISSGFKNYFDGKRPDFLILIPNFGFIFVDVKYKKLNQDYKTYPIDAVDVKKYSVLQRRFNLQIWFAISNEEVGFKTWMWIPVAKVFESGIPKFNSGKSNMDFFALKPEEFIQIAEDDSLERLFSKCFV